jgi:hypothetical protein
MLQDVSIEWRYIVLVYDIVRNGDCGRDSLSPMLPCRLLI